MTEARPKRPIGVGRRLAFSLVVFGLFWVLLELGLQVAALRVGPQGHYPPGLDLPTPDPAAYRVLGVGDSWVFGAESEPHEAFLEVFAAAKRADGPVQVFNLGVPGSNSAQALVSLHDTIELIQPDLVVALTGANNQIHDRAAGEAARLLGEDPRLVSGWSRWSGLKTAKLLRLIWINVFALPADRPSTAEDQLLAGGDLIGEAGLPAAPARRAATIYLLPWWDLYRQRRWGDALTLLRSTPVPDQPRGRGLVRAWEALLLAHLDQPDDSEAAAREALDLGGDRAVAWEARAITALRQDRPLHALQHRLRASDTAADDGFPWIRERARGLALLELEAWEAAEVWLMGCELASPGNLEVLMGLARLSGAARTAEAEEALFTGPRGLVTPMEYFEWHLASSGMADRAVGSLGDPDPDEAPELLIYRGRAAALSDDPEGARRWFQEVLAAESTPPVQRDRAIAGLVRLASNADELGELLGSAQAATTATTAPALIAWWRRQGDCEAAVRTAMQGFALGISAASFEAEIGECLTRQIGWSLNEQALAAGAVVDRAALVLGLPAGRRPGPLVRPSVLLWDRFVARDYEAFARRNEPAWQALAWAHRGLLDDVPELLRQAEEAGGDAAVIAYTRALVHQQSGRPLLAFEQLVLAAASEGDPWVRTTTRGLAGAWASRWASAQRDLLASLRVAPGYLEALEALAEAPPEVRVAGTDLVLRDAPFGAVPPHRWARWYAAQERYPEARLALRWPKPLVPPAPGDPLRDLVALGVTLAAEGDPHAAAELDRAIDEADAAGDPRLGCAALTARARLTASADQGPMLSAACATDATALAEAGRLAASRQDCPSALSLAERSVLAGADPLPIAGWIAPCGTEATLESWLPAATPALPEWGRAWLANRLHPQPEAAAAPTADDVLVKHLAAMARLSETQGARFVALTYPFPGAHHRHVRERLLAGQTRYRLLDLYAHFEATFDEATWQGLRTPEDHVNARGYREMGEVLHADTRGEP